MQRRKSTRHQKPGQAPAQESPASIKETRSKAKDVLVKETTAVAPPPLPTKLTPTQPIPTVKHPQSAQLPDTAWQSVGESGVLKASLERSRLKWMSPGIFELYYSKAGKKKLPNKGKRQAEDTNKHDDKPKDGVGDGTKDKEPSESIKAKQMRREGNCRLYIDPHQWDITIWTMRDKTGLPPPRPKPTPPVPSYPHQQGPYIRGSADLTTPYQHYPPPQPVRQSDPPTAPNLSLASSPHPTGSKPAPDPVIHMLAQRANTDYKLRDVMKIVARGDASKQQLEYFQSHISELTKQLAAQKRVEREQQSPESSYTNSYLAPQSTHPNPAPPPPVSATVSSPVQPDPAAAAPSKMPQQPPMTYYTPPPRPEPYGHYAPPPRETNQHHSQPPPLQSMYHALCIDFNTNGDRFLFPRETILEALPNNQVLASFLKVQKADEALLAQLPKAQKYYTAEKEYYQPITVRFRATDDGNANVLNSLFRWVKPPDEVRKHMDNIMDRAELAEDVELAARLPRDSVAQEGTEIPHQPAGAVRERRGSRVKEAAVEGAVQAPLGERERRRSKRAR